MELHINYFVQIPVQKLINKLIKYKAELQGIKAKFKEKNYTNSCSDFDLEPILKKCYDKSRRVDSGLFK